MDLRRRAMRPGDVRECAEIVAAHPVIGARYGRTIKDLAVAWLRLLESEARTAVVVERIEGSRATICVVGVSIFANDDFVRELKAVPLVWIGPELAKRVKNGNSPILTREQMRQSNSRGGMNLVVWEGCFGRGAENVPEVQRAMMNAFVEDHRGFLWKEVIGSQAESAERLEWMMMTGGMFWDPAQGKYIRSLKGEREKIASRPHMIGITRDLEARGGKGWSSSWVGALFDYRPPRLGFSAREQQLLLLAATGECGTDSALADALGVATGTVKKMWLSIYGRVADERPEIVPDQAHWDSGRGIEKRRRLLAYLREHPEELRPCSRRYLPARQSERHR